MKGSHGIKRLYGGAGRGYGGGGRICPDFAMTKGRPITMSVCNHDWDGEVQWIYRKMPLVWHSCSWEKI